MELVKEIQARVEKYSLHKVYDTLLKGTITNTLELTRVQVLTADEVLGTDTAYHKGIHTERLQNKNTEKTDPTSTDIMM